MPRIDDENKQELKQQIWLMVQQNHGIRTQEIASRLNLQIRRLNNYLRDLRDEGKIRQEGWSWYPEEFSGPRLYRFELSPVEVITLYLGARLLVKQHDHRNEPAETALRKLAAVLRSDAPIGKEIERVADELAQRNNDPRYQSIFRTVAEAYAYRKKIKLVYKRLREKAFDTTFETYLIEPSLVGAATYIIGKSSIEKDGREHSHYKLGRIQSAEMIDEPYDIPQKYQSLEVMRDAWSVIGGEAKEEVELRFHPDVAERIQETKWHSLEELPFPDPEKPGWLRWKTIVPNVLDMRPWIKGWGAKVEVLKPDELREELTNEAREMARLYKVLSEKPMEKHWLLWGKTNRPINDKLHLLICHLIDVGNVGLEVWGQAFTLQFKKQLANALNLKVDEAGRLVAFLAAMHDLGKACPAFQHHLKDNKPKLQDHYKKIVEAGFNTHKESCSHGFVTTFSLISMLESKLNMPDNLARELSIVIGGHHGRWPTSYELDNQKSVASDGIWDDARKGLFEDVKNIFNPPNVEKYDVGQEAKNMLLVTLAGIVSVVDWLGSMENPFGYCREIQSVDEYDSRSKRNARKVIAKEHWADWEPPSETMSFVEQFKHAHITEPRGAQQFIIELAEKLNVPSLVIIEDATGSGKTEAAWYLADHWTRILGNRGAYVAMPTMATSNSLHKRVNIFLETRYPEKKKKIEAILVHSQARFADDNEERKMQSNDIAEGANKNNEVNALAWFEDKRKRSLLAPFGVGTVDQTFLSVLQTNHFFVRLFALAHKTIIFDEVHAYDTYMTEIFQTLLRWLRALGSSVIILSATLPVSTRQKLVEAYGGDKSQANDTKSSSVITWVSGTETAQQPLPMIERSPVHVEWIGRSPLDIAQRLQVEMRDGGCVAIICNRVTRAQDVYKAIKKEFEGDTCFVPRDNLLLFHARFPMAWRDEIEDKVLKQADKKSKRDKPFIVVATQVIEQSLDLDFDLMITDLPPIDLLIQRVGRLHRHKEHDTLRPEVMKVPRLLITKPEQEGEVPQFGLDARIYNYFILLRTWLELKHIESDNHITLTLPVQSRELIEAVYASEDKMPDFSVFTEKQQSQLRGSWKKMRQGDETDEKKAILRTIENPDDDLIRMDNLALSDDDSKQSQEGLSAMTRLCLPTAQAICLLDTASGLMLLDDNQHNVNLNEKPTAKLTKQLIRWTISVTRPNVYRHFVTQPVSEGWKEHSLLKSYHAAKFIQTANDEYVCKLTSNLTLHLSKEIGLEIE